MSDVTFGEILVGREQRDAVHIAIAPVVADRILAGGQHIGFVKEGNTDLVGPCDNPIGVVDPFLKGYVAKGERFWMLLYPQTITSLRHDWTHPAFKPQALSVSEAYLHSYANEVGIGYDELLQAAEDYLDAGDIYCLGNDTPGIVWSEREEFWRHYQAVTGRTVEDTEATFFRCAC